MIWMKVTPLFMGAFLLVMGLAVQSEKKGEGESPFVLVPLKLSHRCFEGFDLPPEEEPFPLLEPTKETERETWGELWTQFVPVSLAYENKPDLYRFPLLQEYSLIREPISTKNIPDPSLKPERIWVYTDSGAYLFHDLETATAFAQPDEVVMSEDGTVYGGEPEIGNLKIVECIAKNSTFESDCPVVIVEKNVQEVVLW